jgi:hypothetical protein
MVSDYSMKSEQNNFEELVDNVYQTHYLLQQNAQKAINLMND